MLIFGVNTCCCFIKNYNVGIFQNGAGNRNTLFFSARQRRAALTDHRFISIGKSHNEVVATSLFRSFYNFFLRCTWIAETDVVFNGIVEQVDLSLIHI